MERRRLRGSHKQTHQVDNTRNVFGELHALQYFCFINCEVWVKRNVLKKPGSDQHGGLDIKLLPTLSTTKAHMAVYI